MGRTLEVSIDWFPQPKQQELFKAAGLLDVVLYGDPPKPALAEAIGYGGAAFGGKSDGLVGLAITACLAYPGVRVGYFRRTFSDLQGSAGAIPRSLELLTGFADYNKSEHKWTFPNGSEWYFCHCQYEENVYNYKSQAWDILLIDEATTFTWFQVDYLITRNRPTGDSGCKPFRVMTSNPGDVGHAWYCTLFDLLKALGNHSKVKRTRNPNDKEESVYFIPAFLEDNTIGVERDPDYEARLMARDPQVAKALRFGDWTIFEGQAIVEWRYDRHTCDYFELPMEWPRWRSLDYGFTHPMAAYWFAKNPVTQRIYTYREIVQAQLTDQAQARLIRDASLHSERFLFTFAAPDMWQSKNFQGLVTTSVEEYAKEGIYLTKADDDRINGLTKIHRLLADLPDGQPGVMVMRNCTDLIRLIPSLVRDKTRPEDVKKVDGDDPYDGWRYGFTNTEIKQEKKSEHQKSPLERIARIL